MQNPEYAKGFRSQNEEIAVEDLPVEGTIPEWLSGSLIRTAPSKFEVGENRYRHWFDGLAMLHKFSFKGGKAGYSCNFLQSDAYRKAMEKNRIVYSEFGTDPCRDLFQKFFSFFRQPVGTDNGCVNINLHGQLTATTETPKYTKFNLNSLETEGILEYDDDVEGHVTTAHPHYDPDGTLYSYFTRFGYKSKYNVYSKAPGSEKRKLIASVPSDYPAYMHSFGMTENYIILTEIPLVANPLNFQFGNKTFAENYKWKPERGTKVHLVHKVTGKVQSFLTEPFFFFHHVNAHEEGDNVFFDIVAYEDADVINQLYLDYILSEEESQVSGQLWRFHIDLVTGTIKKEEVSSAFVELPRTNYARINTRPYQFVYGTGISKPGDFLDNIIKIDTGTGEYKVWYNEGYYPGEPVFVEAPDARSEDDGVLLSIVLDTREETSFLLVLDAGNLEEIGRAYVPQHITFGFHGQYVMSEDPEQVRRTIHA